MDSPSSSFSSLHSQFAPSQSDLSTEDDTPQNILTKKRTLTKNQTDSLVLKKQRLSMEISNPVLILEEKSELKAKIQQCFEDIGILQVEIGMKNGEIFRAKQEAYNIIQKIQEPTERLSIEQGLMQQVGELEKQLQEFQSKYDMNTKLIENSRKRIKEIEREEASLRWNDLYNLSNSEIKPNVSPNQSPIPIKSDSSPNQINNSSLSLGLNSTNQRSNSYGDSIMQESTIAESSDIVEIEPAPAWHKDEEHPLCEICRAQFSFFVRKHHCRKCGRVICDSCSKARMSLPRYGFSEPVRVCRECEFILLDYQKIIKRQYRNSFEIGSWNGSPQGNRRLFSAEYLQQRKKEKQKRASWLNNFASNL